MEYDPNPTFFRPENEPNSKEKKRGEEENEKARGLIKEAKTLWDLKQIITDNKITFYGASQVFYPDMLVQVIDKVTDDDPKERWPITMATNAGGFRDLIRDLCLKAGLEINDDEGGGR